MSYDSSFTFLLLLFYLLEDTDRSLSSSDHKLYLRRKIIADLSSNVTIDIEQLEQTYSSSIIQQIYLIYIDDSRLKNNNRSDQLLAAVIISQAEDTSVLKELETISKLKQLHTSQIPQVILIERESKLVSLGDLDRSLLKHQYQIKISNILLEHGDANGEIIEIIPKVTEQQQELLSSRSLIETDMILDPNINQSLIESRDKANNKDIFLTGSAGFLGRYLLDELLKQTDANIYCLVRSQTPRNTSDSRVFYLDGDLSLPHFGLDDHQYSMLVSKIRSIYHCGAMVNFIKSYSELRSANVLGTLEIIKLAYRANCRINYISTLSVLHDDDQNGYVQSKQVAESLLEQARERDLLVTILRPGKMIYFVHCLVNLIMNQGLISWRTSTGDSNRRDWINLLLLDLIEFGSAPQSDFTLDIVPVDHISQKIVELGESEQTIEATIDLPLTHTISFRIIWTEICRQRQIEPHFINVTEWRQKLDERLKTDSQSLHGLQLFSHALTDSFSKETITTTGTESDLNLPLFVTSLLRN